MNSKLCKRLRHHAEALTVGKPARRSIGKKVRVSKVRGGKTVEYTETIALNDPQSTRGVYRQLKREVRAAARRIA